ACRWHRSCVRTRIPDLRQDPGCRPESRTGGVATVGLPRPQTRRLAATCRYPECPAGRPASVSTRNRCVVDSSSPTYGCQRLRPTLWLLLPAPRRDRQLSALTRDRP